MALSHFSILIHAFLNKDTDIVPEEAPLIILDGRSYVCMAKMVRIPNTLGTFLEEYIL